MKRGFFRVDFSNAIGRGHLSRARLMAKEINKLRTAKLDLIVGGEDCSLSAYLGENFSNIYFEKDYLIPINRDLEKYNFGIFDFSHRANILNANYVESYLESYKKTTNKIVLMDGLGADSLYLKNNKIPIDLLVVPYVGAKESEYNHPDCLLGMDYFIFNDELKNLVSLKDGKCIRKIVVTMGGGDPSEQSIYIAKLLAELSSSFEIWIVVGPSFSKNLIIKLREFVSLRHNFNLFDGENGIYKLLSDADLCISASGLTKYELLYLEIPTIVLIENEELKSINNDFISLETALPLEIGIKNESSIALELIKKCISSEALRVFMKKRCQMIKKEIKPNILIDRILN